MSDTSSQGQPQGQQGGKPSEPSANGGCSGQECKWSATHDLMPPSPGRLRVHGICIMPTPGYILSLTKTEPQGINPRILLLDLKVEKPTGPVPQIETEAEVLYTENTNQPFGQVTILPDGPTIDVETVH